MTSLKQLLDTGYEDKLPVFAGPMELLLYLVEKDELDPKDIAIATITDQYLEYLQTLEQTHLSNAGEFLVMAARLMRLKARELLPSDQKDDLEEMEYLLDRQALIAQMLEYQKFKDAARGLRAIEAQNFGAFPRGRPETPGSEDAEDHEAGVYDLLSAFRSVLLQQSHIPVHEVEIDDVTIEDRMQYVESELLRSKRCLFEDLFESDPRRMVKVVTFMAVMELCKLDRIQLRQHRVFGAIWVYARETDPTFALELEAAGEIAADPLPEFRPGLVEWVQAQIQRRKAQTSWEEMLAAASAEPGPEDNTASPDTEDIS
jgi:chromatin segregation and condensation protein Rec8/ScpA/Scc1 (kleisin family)